MSIDAMVGERIRKAREKKMLLLDGLAQLVEVSAHYLGQVEAGHERPEPELLIVLANKTDAEVSYFLDSFHRI